MDKSLAIAAFCELKGLEMRENRDFFAEEDRCLP